MRRLDRSRLSAGVAIGYGQTRRRASRDVGGFPGGFADCMRTHALATFHRMVCRWELATAFDADSLGGGVEKPMLECYKSNGNVAGCCGRTA